MRTILQQRGNPEAVVTCSDFLAIGAMKAIREQGLRIPDDIAIVGADDIDMAAYSDPPLTSIKIRRRDMGREAAEIVIGLATGQYDGPSRRSWIMS